MDLDDPTTVALLAAEAFDRAGASHALYGGLLSAAYGEPRETRDADFAVIDLTVPEASRAMAALGLDTAVSFEEVRFGGLTIGRLAILGSRASIGLNTIDLVRPRSDRYARLALARAADAPLRDRIVKVLTPEDFIVFKVLSTRDRDLDDAAGVLRRSRDVIDLDEVRCEVERLAAEIEGAHPRARLQEVVRRGNEGFPPGSAHDR